MLITAINTEQNSPQELSIKTERERVDSAGEARDEGGGRSKFCLEAVRAKILPSLGSQA